MDGDHRILALNQIWVWTPSRAPEMDAEGQIQLVQAQKRVVHVHRSLMDLTSSRTFSCIFILRLSRGQRAEPLDPCHLGQRLIPSRLPLKCQYLQPCLVTLRGPDATQAGPTPANSTLPGRGRGGNLAGLHKGSNENKLPCQRGGQLCS